MTTLHTAVLVGLCHYAGDCACNAQSNSMHADLVLCNTKLHSHRNFNLRLNLSCSHLNSIRPALACREGVEFHPVCCMDRAVLLWKDAHHCPKMRVLEAQSQ